jgi:pyridoxine 4-oxidase
MAYDDLIIGGGTAGVVLAARFSEDRDRRVCLVEAGGPASDDPDIADPLKWPALQGRAIDWRYETVPQAGAAGRRHPWPRGRVLGGSSAINAMAHVRGHPSDFDGWGIPGWGFADLFPYFLKSEHWTCAPSPWHGTGGPVHLIQPDPPHPLVRSFHAAAQARGLPSILDHNGPAMAGATVNTLTIKDGRRQTTADAYLTPDVLDRPNLSLLLRAEVRHLDLDGPRCRGAVLASVATCRTICCRAAISIIRDGPCRCRATSIRNRCSIWSMGRALRRSWWWRASPRPSRPRRFSQKRSPPSAKATP